MTILSNQMTINQPALSSFYGLNVTVASNTTLGVAAGQGRDSTNTIDIILGTAVVIDTAVTGANGLDTGSLAASTWYYSHIIADSSGKKVTACILSASRTAPVLPFGYDSFRWVSVERTDGSVHFLARNVVGNGITRTHVWDANIVALAGGTASTLTAIDLTASVPPIDLLLGTFQVDFTPATANDTASLAPFGSTATLLPHIAGSVAAKVNSGQLRVITKLNTTSKILYINSAASGATSVWTCGFEYYL